jgi:hypothetical protein
MFVEPVLLNNPASARRQTALSLALSKALTCGVKGLPPSLLRITASTRSATLPPGTPRPAGTEPADSLLGTR